MFSEIQPYYKLIESSTPLSPDEEVDLVIRAQLGDREAREKLVFSNLKFVVQVAKNYQGVGLSLADLIGEGNIGLLKAVDRFDPRRGFKFISYAVWWIRQSILEALSEYSQMIRLPLNRINQLIKIKRLNELMLHELGREVSLSETVQRFGPEKAIYDALTASELQSLDSDEYSHDITGTLDLELDNISRKDKAEDLTRAFSCLSEREREIIISYYGLLGDPPQTLVELGEKYGFSRERARQIKMAALDKIKKSKKACRLLKGG